MRWYDMLHACSRDETYVKLVGGKSETNIQLGIFRHRLEENIKTDLKEIMSEHIDRTHMSHVMKY